MVDNQFVRQGDVLYVIEPFDFEVAVRTAEALVAQRAADLEVKQVQSERRQHLSNLATTPEEQQSYASSAAQAKAAFDAAQQQLAQAELNLRRTKVVSPVNGYVTNLLLRVGDYAPTGVTNISVIDSDSYWIDGYFEETKMARICVGDRAEAKLMGYAEPIVGHVETITRGISVSNAAAGTQGLPDVDPIYTWVRLAQRVPVRIAIDEVPIGVPLVSGMTATVTIRRPAEPDHRNWFDRAHTNVVDSLSALFHGPPASRPGCLSALTTQPPPTESIPAPKERPAPHRSRSSQVMPPAWTYLHTVPTSRTADLRRRRTEYGPQIHARRHVCSSACPSKVIEIARAKTKPIPNRRRHSRRAPTRAAKQGRIAHHASQL